MLGHLHTSNHEETMDFQEGFVWLGPCFCLAKKIEAPGADNIYGNILRARRSLKTGEGIPEPGKEK